MLTVKLIDKTTEGILTKLSMSKVDTWIDKGHQEGIEFQAGKIKPFWVKSGDRIYGEPPSDQFLKIINSIISSETEKISKEIQKTECNEAIIPETFSTALIEKWQKMSTIDRMLLFQHTPQDKILERQGNGGKTLKYVTGNYMLREANAAFLFAWNFEIKGMNIGDKAVAVWGTLYVNIDGNVVHRDCVGYEDVNTYMNVQLAIKSATTDCMKKGLSLFGFNNDVYSGEV